MLLLYFNNDMIIIDIHDILWLYQGILHLLHGLRITACLDCIFIDRLCNPYY